MNKTIRRNVVVSAILAIMLCVSLIAGATFALFTSESKVNIAVTSGKVNLTAKIDETSVKTKANGDADYISGADHMYEATARFDDGGLTLTNLLPGDGICFNIVVTNDSNVTVKYRTVIGCEVDEGLLDGLTVLIDGEAYDGSTKISPYATLPAGSSSSVATVPVSVEMDETAGNEYQNKTFKFTYKVEAVQGNADTSDPDQNTTYIYTANDLANLQNRIVSEGWGITSEKTIEFLSDIDMSEKNYETPHNNGAALYVKSLTVKGNNHTITGLNNPLFNMYGTNITVSDLTIAESTMTKTTNNALGYGAFFEEAQWCNLTMTNCHTNKVRLTAGGTRAAALVGYLVGQAKITRCSVVDSSVTAKGSVAGILGHAIDCVAENFLGQTIENCSVSGSAFSSTDDGGWRVGSIIGTIDQTTATKINGCTTERNTLSQTNKIAPGHDLYGRIVNNGALEIDGVRQGSN